MKKFIYELLKSIYKSIDRIFKVLFSLIGILYIIMIDEFNIYVYYILLIWWIIYAITDFIKSYKDIPREITWTTGKEVYEDWICPHCKEESCPYDEPVGDYCYNCGNPIIYKEEES